MKFLLNGPNWILSVVSEFQDNFSINFDAFWIPIHSNNIKNNIKKTELRIKDNRIEKEKCNLGFYSCCLASLNTLTRKFRKSQFKTQNILCVCVGIDGINFYFYVFPVLVSRPFFVWKIFFCSGILNTYIIQTRQTN